MKNKLKFLLIIIFMIPIIVLAEGQLKQYFDATSDANNYINKYTDRNKYILLNNVKFKYENRALSIDPVFTKGGLLNKSEFDLSVINSKSYLMSGREYWTMTDSTEGSKYYVDNFIFSKSVTAFSGTRVTEQVKGSVKVTGKGTYANPWVFEEGYEVTVTPNNSTYAVITPTTQTVKSGGTASLNVSVKQGFKYANKDDCNLVKRNDTTYEIRNVIKDISCIAIFEETVYKMTLTSTKSYTTYPVPSALYYRASSGWYNNPTTTAKITKITPPTITGYIFGGYKYGSTQIINNSGQILTNTLPGFDYNTEEQRLIADITPITYSVKYNANGGTGTMSNSSHTYDVAETLTKNTFTKVGYNFKGWATSAGGSVVYTDEQSVSNLTSTNGRTVNLYAVWDGKTYTATFNSNGASSIGATSLSCKVANEEGTCDVTAPTITRDGFSVVGWGTTVSAHTGTAVSGTLKMSNNTNYYAITKKDITITFNRNGATSQTPNGGSASTNNSITQTCTIWNSATTCSITSPAITKNGYTIIGYSTATGTHTSSWNVSTTKTVSSSATYYAQMSKSLTATFTVQDANAATKSGGTTTCTMYNGDESCSITAPTLTANSGYTVVGWNTNASATTATILSAAAITMSSNTTYSSITYRTFTGTFSIGSAQATTSATSASCNVYNGATSCTITAPTLTANSGYIVVGWNTNASATNASVASGGTATLTSNTTYYAITKSGSFEITFNYQENITYLEGEYLNTDFQPDWSKNMKIVAKFRIPETGHRYLILGNYKDSTTDATSVVNIEVNDNDQVRLYLGNGLVNKTSGDVKVPANTSITVTFTWDASTKAYSLTGTGGISITGTCASLSNTASKTVRTNIDNRPSNVFGLIKIESLAITVPRTGSLGSLPSPSKYGFSYSGWYDATSGGTQATSSTTVTATKTYYAQKTSTSYLITFNKNGGTYGSMSRIRCKVGAQCTLPATEFGKTDADFVFWSTNSGTKILLYGTLQQYGSCKACNSSEKRNVKEYTNVVKPTVNQEFGLDVDVKGNGRIDNYFYYSNNDDKLQVAKVTTSQGKSSTSKDGHNVIDTTDSWQHYQAYFTMKSSPTDSESKTLLFRVNPGYEGYIKNVRFYQKAASETIHMNKSKVKDLAEAGGTVTLYAIWHKTSTSTSGWRLTCTYEIGSGNTPFTHYYGTEEECNAAKSMYSGTFSCSTCAR